MHEIKEIVEDMWEELEGAEHYAIKYAKLKDKDGNRANVYAGMAKAELEHLDNLHQMAMRCIERHRMEGHPDTAALEMIWEGEHNKIQEKKGKIKYMLAA